MHRTHYVAKLASSGVVFDSSYPKKQPLIWKVGVEPNRVETQEIASAVSIFI